MCAIGVCAKENQARLGSFASKTSLLEKHAQVKVVWKYFSKTDFEHFAIEFFDCCDSLKWV